MNVFVLWGQLSEEPVRRFLLAGRERKHIESGRDKIAAKARKMGGGGYSLTIEEMPLERALAEMRDGKRRRELRLGKLSNVVFCPDGADFDPDIVDEFLDL